MAKGVSPKGVNFCLSQTRLEEATSNSHAKSISGALEHNDRVITGYNLCDKNRTSGWENKFYCYLPNFAIFTVVFISRNPSFWEIEHVLSSFLKPLKPFTTSIKGLILDNQG